MICWEDYNVFFKDRTEKLNKEKLDALKDYSVGDTLALLRNIEESPSKYDKEIIQGVYDILFEKGIMCVWCVNCCERKTPLKILRINGKTYIITKLTEIEWMELKKRSSKNVYRDESQRSIYDSFETKIVEDQFNVNIIRAMVAYPRSIIEIPLPQTKQHELISQCVDYQLRSMR